MRLLRPCRLALLLLAASCGAARADVAYKTSILGVADGTLASALHDNSRLVTLENRPPESEAALRRRAEEDVPRLLQLLHDEGYWAAAIDPKIDAAPQPATVTLQVEPGPLYHLGAVEFRTPEGAPPPLLETTSPSVFGLVIGGPARAAPVVDAATRIADFYAENGRPFAKLVDHRVVIDDGARTMGVALTVAPGPPARFGPVRVDGLQTLDAGYVLRRVTWHEDAPYDQRDIDATRRALVDSNLFSVVQIEHADEPDAEGRLAMTIAVVERLPRSIGASVDYSTSLGLGAAAFWEHRNLFGNAEKLRITAQFAQSQLGLLTQFRRPDLGAANQDLLATIDLADEKPVAYESRRLRVSSGLERRLGTDLTVGGAAAYEHGTVTAHETTQHYQLVGLPLSLKEDTTDNLLDPARGHRFTVEATPYHGIAGTDLAFVTGRATATAYYPLAADRYVISGFARLGSIVGNSRDRLPADKRLYAGGGGSLRGYGYQRAGPLDLGLKPLGGKSSLEFGGELRIKVTETIGVVPFLEVGNVYTASLPSDRGGLLYDAGIGVRYYTPVGPIRLDLATPLRRRPGDSLIQVYISLGQAF